MHSCSPLGESPHFTEGERRLRAGSRPPEVTQREGWGHGFPGPLLGPLEGSSPCPVQLGCLRTPK